MDRGWKELRITHVRSVFALCRSSRYCINPHSSASKCVHTCVQVCSSSHEYFEKDVRQAFRLRGLGRRGRGPCTQLYNFSLIPRNFQKNTSAVRCLNIFHPLEIYLSIWKLVMFPDSIPSPPHSTFYWPWACCKQGRKFNIYHFQIYKDFPPPLINQCILS